MSNSSPEKTFLLVNPASGWGKGARMAERLRIGLRERGVEFSEAQTKGRGHAAELAARAVEQGASSIVVCGGDGTMNEAAQALAGSPVRMVPAPAGRCNDFFRALSADTSLDRVLENAATRSSRQLDLVKVNGCYYCTVGAVGFDADVSRFVDEMKAPLHGKPAYVYGIMRVLTGYRTPEVRFTWDDGVYEGPMFLAAVANTPTYGNAIPVVPMAKPDDGMLDICLVGPVGFFKVVGMLPKIMKGTHGSADQVRFLRSKRVKVESDSKVELWADGEPLAETPLDIEVVPQSLCVAGRS